MHPYEDRILVDEKRGLFAVADGVTHSTRGSGGVAAELALRLLHDYFTNDVVEAMKKIHQKVMRERENDITIGETTLTVASVRGDYLSVGNIGDSPAYLIHRGVVHAMFTADTSPLGYITQVVGHPKNIRVHIVEARLRRGDMVIVASDGVGHVLRPSFVVPLTKGLNSDSVVKEIIQEAQLKVNEYDDDKSMVVLRVVG